MAANKAVELSARLNEVRARLVTTAAGTGTGGAAGAGAGAGSGGAGFDDGSGMAGQLAEVGKLQMELQVCLRCFGRVGKGGVRAVGCTFVHGGGVIVRLVADSGSYKSVERCSS